MNERPRIAPGSHVKLHIAISLGDGTEALSTFDEDPLQIVVGDGTLDPGIELALYGMGAGDTDSVSLQAGQAFGAADPKLIQTMPLSDFPADAQPKEGQIIAFTTPGGEEMAGAVKSVSKQTAEIDFNHPLAGHDLLLRIEILGVVEPTGDQPSA